MSTSRRYSPSSEHAAIAALATAQHGVVSRAQLRRAGFTTAGIDNGVKCGRLLLLHRGVYAVGHRPPSHQARAMAAVLACGPKAALSHRSAAALWQMGLRWHTPLEVSAPSAHRVPGVRTHRCRSLEATREFGIPVTTPVRTLLDLVGVVDDAPLIRAINAARLAGRLPADEFAVLVERLPRRLERLLAPTGRADPVRIRGRVPALRAPPRSAASRGQPARRRSRGRHAVAPPAADRGARRPRVP